MILYNLLRYREAQSNALRLSVADKGLKNGVPDRRRNAGTVVPDANFQAGPISDRGYSDLAGVRRNRLTSIEDEVGNHAFETAGVEPAHS